MKTPVLSLFIGGLMLLRLPAQPATSIPRLAGVVCLSEQTLAILEVVPTRSGQAQHLILRDGQREGEVEVLEIDSEKGVVKLNVGWTNVTINFSFENQTNQPAGNGFGIMLDRAELDPVLKIYSEFEDVNLLCSPLLPAVVFSLNASPTNKPQAALVLEQALAEKGMATIPDGEKFVMVVPESEAATVKPRSSEIKSAVPTGDRTELIPPGAINFSPAPLNQAAQIYAAFVGRKLESDPRSTLPEAKIKFQNQTPLSKDELVYALDTLFHWQGLKVVPAGDGLVKLIQE